jgi:hypothetical protein
MRFIKTLFVGLVLTIASSLVAVVAVRKSVPVFGGEDDAEFSVLAAMGGVEFQARTQHLTEARATAFMGGVELDLSGAELAPGAYLTLRAVMGGMDLIVPAHWRVEVMARAVMGGIGNLTDPDSVADDAPLLLVDALAVMGGIEIHAQETS